MQKFLAAIVIVLVVSVSVNAQYLDLQRSNNSNYDSTNPIRPEITNDLSYLGAAYTLGTEAGNLTGEYGDYVQLHIFRKFNPDDIGIMVALYDKAGNQKSLKNISLELGINAGFIVDFDVIISGDDLFYNIFCDGLLDMRTMKDISVFDMIGGYIDYFAVSGSGYVELRDFSVGGGWIADQDNFGHEDMLILRGFNGGFTGTPQWIGTRNLGPGAGTTWSSRALAYNTGTGFSMKGAFVAHIGLYMPMESWRSLTFTFGSFERVPAPAEVPEPGTLLMLGLAAAGLPVVRRLRK